MSEVEPTPKTEQTPEEEALEAKAETETVQAPELAAGQPEADAVNADTAEAEDGEEKDFVPSSEQTEDAGPTIEDLQAEIAELNDKLLRAVAETENVRRRALRDREEASKYAIANFARDIIGVADNMQRAVDSIDTDLRKDSSAVDNVAVGLEMSAREVMSIFERFGIKKIEALGGRFDHNLHEALFEFEDPSKPAGTVFQIMETGYTLNGRLLRPAKVGVTKGGAREEEAAAPAEAKEGEANAETPDTEAKTAYESRGSEPGTNVDQEL